MDNIYFWIWWTIASLSNAISIWVSTKCFDTNIPKKLYSVGMFLLWTIPPLLLSALGEPWSDFKPITSALIPLIATPFMLKGSKITIILFFVVNQMLDFIMDLIISVGIQIINPNYLMIDLQHYSEARIIATLIFILAIIPIKYLYCRVWNRFVNKENFDRINNIYIFFPLGQAIVIMCMMYQTISLETWIGIPSTAFSLIGFTLLAIIDGVFLMYLTDIDKNHRLKQELDRMEYAHSLEKEHYQSIENKRYEIAKIRHDIKNQLISVQHLINTQCYDEAGQLLGELRNNLDNTKESEYCSVPIINAVLSQKHQLCKEKGISLSADISISDTGQINQMHMCSIFSNLLDNAINANEKLPRPGERYISISAREKQGHIVVSVENPVGEKTPKNITPSTSSGYGLKILQDIADTYSGQFKIECDSKAYKAILLVYAGENEHILV